MQGLGLQGSDRVALMRECGVGAEPPAGWAEGLDDETWINDGWVSRAADFTDPELYTFGIPLSRLSISSIPPGMNMSFRGIFGFPNFGISVPHATPGYFSWEGPTWAFAGTYRLCWCGADATIDGCDSAADFLTPIGRLRQL